MLTLQEVVRLLWAGEVPPKALNGKPPRYSATTVKQVKECARKHWFEQVVGIDPPRRAALHQGSELHNLVERQQKGKTELSPLSSNPMEVLAAKGVPFLPKPLTPGVFVERAFTMGTWPNGPEFTGTMDLAIAPKSYNEDEHKVDRDDFAELLDHKSTGSYAKYAARGWALSASPTLKSAKSPGRKYLDDDEQCIAYSRRLLLWYPVDTVRATWLYYPKDGGDVMPVRAVMERKETLDKWTERIVPLIEQMQHQHVQRPSLRTVEANEQACDNFGGCPHRAYCVDYKHGQEKGHEMGSLADRLLKGHKEETKAKPKDEAPAVNPPAPAAAAKKSPFASMGDAAPKAAAPKEAAPKEEPKETKKEKAQLTPQPQAPAGAGFALFLGCEPVVTKRPKVDFVLFLQPLIEHVTKVHKVASIGEVKYDGVNHTVAALEEWLTEHGETWAGSNVVVPATGFYNEVATRALYTKAAAVSRGVA